MPIYEYQCSKCKAKIEAVQKVSDPPPKKCEKCGGPLKKVISASALQFKGNGWYVTDYARKGKSEEEEKGKSKPKREEGNRAKSGAPKESPSSSSE